LSYTVIHKNSRDTVERSQTLMML